MIILLKPGCSAINVQPFRCPYFQKHEIEKIVREMPETSTIRQV